jgi:DNA-binding phage protein
VAAPTAPIKVLLGQAAVPSRRCVSRTAAGLTKIARSTSTSRASLLRAASASGAAPISKAGSQ